MSINFLICDLNSFLTVSWLNPFLISGVVDFKKHNHWEIKNNWLLLFNCLMVASTAMSSCPRYAKLHSRQCFAYHDYVSWKLHVSVLLCLVSFQYFSHILNVKYINKILLYQCLIKCLFGWEAFSPIIISHFYQWESRDGHCQQGDRKSLLRC